MKPLCPSAYLFSVLWLVSVPVALATDSVNGHFQHRGERIDFHHGVAIRVADPQAPGGHEIIVLLSDAIPDAERGRGKRNPIGNIEAGLPFDSARLLLHVRGPDTAPVIHRLSHDGYIATSPGGEELALKQDRLIGTWRASDSDSDWQADLRFDLPVLDFTTPD